MKPLKRVTVFALALLLCSSISAAIPDTSEFQKIPNHLKKTLSLKMSFPQEASDMGVEGVVTTCFYLTNDGEIKVTCLSGHPVLTAYVKRKMEGMELKQTYAIRSKPMLIRFRFENPLY